VTCPASQPARGVQSDVLLLHIVAGAAAVPGRCGAAVLPVLYPVRLVVPPAHECAQAPVAGVDCEDLQQEPRQSRWRT
jgi:hypothetical protein